MALQIAYPGVVAKVERRALATGLSKTAMVERALVCRVAFRRDLINYYWKPKQAFKRSSAQAAGGLAALPPMV